jgi:hypothetical protein
VTVIGFEDTPRGLKALIDARRHFETLSNNDDNDDDSNNVRVVLLPLFVTGVQYPELDRYLELDSGDDGDEKQSKSEFLHVASLNDIDVQQLKSFLTC